MLSLLCILSLFILPLKTEAFFLEDDSIDHLDLLGEDSQQELLICSVVKTVQGPTFQDNSWTDENTLSPFFYVEKDSLSEEIGYDELFESEVLWPTDKVIILTNYYTNHTARKAVERQIELFSERLKDNFATWLSRSSQYLPIMRKILLENGLPEDLVFLPLIESGFNLYAYSRARAVGPWQFMKGTARMYDLEVNFWVDERRDPIKSTHAASRYLKDLYERFGSWDLAMAAYNAGEGKIARAIRRTRTDDFWHIYKTRYIKRETKYYVPKFLAAREIATKPEGYGFEELDYSPPLDFDVVTITTPADLNFIATAAETTVDQIKQLNPELRRWCIPRDVKEYTLRIPLGKKEKFLSAYYSTPPNKRYRLDSYRVKKGDTPSKIAYKERIPLKVLYKLNNIKNPRRIRTGTILFLPPKDESYTMKKSPPKKKIPRKNLKV